MPIPRMRTGSSSNSLAGTPFTLRRISASRGAETAFTTRRLRFDPRIFGPRAGGTRLGHATSGSTVWTRIRSVGLEAFLVDQGHEPAKNGARHGWAFGAAHDELEALVVPRAHGKHQASARPELRIERGRRLGRCRGDGDRCEGRVGGIAEARVRVVNGDALRVSGRLQVPSRLRG